MGVLPLSSACAAKLGADEAAAASTSAELVALYEGADELIGSLVCVIQYHSISFVWSDLQYRGLGCWGRGAHQSVCVILSNLFVIMLGSQAPYVKVRKRQR